jgi:hypothetical protein
MARVDRGTRVEGHSAWCFHRSTGAGLERAGEEGGTAEERKKEEGKEREKLEWNDNRRRRSVVGSWVGVRWGG